MANHLRLEMKGKVLGSLVTGASIASIEKCLGVHGDTIMRTCLTVGEACTRMHDTLVAKLHTTVIEVDEIWTFVHTKQGHLRADSHEDHGDQWVFVALDAATKLVVSYRVGKRTAENTQVFMDDLRRRVLGRATIVSDGFAGYPEAIDVAFGGRANYGQMVKQYAGTPQRLVGIEKRLVMGYMPDDRIRTSFVERQNLTMRMCMRRFTRRTNGFSKRLRNLRASVGLHFAYYNWVRVHETLRVTPAMEAGLTDHPWSIAELLDVLKAYPAPPENDTTPVAPSGRPVLRLIPGGRT